jgi:hypothetical protein
MVISFGKIAEFLFYQSIEIDGGGSKQGLVKKKKKDKKLKTIIFQSLIRYIF